MASPQTKTCLRCNQTLSAEVFHRDKNRKDGRYPYCRQCSGAEAKRRRASSDWKAHKSEYDRSRYADTRAERIASAKRHYAADPERVKQRVRAWVTDNPDRRKATAQSYKHRRRAVEAAGMSGELRRWTDAQRKACHWCGKRCPKAFTVDHVTPLSKGGKHEADNLVIACRPCNLRKNARDPFEWAQMIGRLL